mgnify:CR=1 FL=1
MSAVEPENYDETTDPKYEPEGRENNLRPWTESPESVAARGGGRPFSQVPFCAACPEWLDPDGPYPNDARYHAFVSGVGAGKTTAGIIRTVANMERWNPGEMGMIVGPTVPHLKNAIIPEMRKWGLLDHWEYQGKGAEQPGLVNEKESRAILESADNERKIQRLRGPSLAWFWIDEAAYISKKAWDALIARLRTGRYRNGYITTTPQGFNWVWERFYGEGDGPPEDVNLTYGVPSTVSPVLPGDYEAITDEYTGHFREQEVMGLFVQPEGLVFPDFNNDNILEVDDPEDGLPVNPRRTIYGVDWGFTNPSAIVAVIETRTDEWYVVDEFFDNRVTDNDLAEIAIDMQDRWGEGVFYCDPAEPDSIETFQRQGLNATAANNELVPGIKTVTTLMDDLYVRDVPCTNLINEMNQYHYPDDDEDTEEPVDKNNHAVDALRYVLHTVNQGALNIGAVADDRFYEGL